MYVGFTCMCVFVKEREIGKGKTLGSIKCIGVVLYLGLCALKGLNEKRRLLV